MQCGAVSAALPPVCGCGVGDFLRPSNTPDDCPPAPLLFLLPLAPHPNPPPLRRRLLREEVTSGRLAAAASKAEVLGDLVERTRLDAGECGGWGVRGVRGGGGSGGGLRAGDGMHGVLLLLRLSA